MKFFHGDGPERQFESGNNHGGRYPCLCGSPVHMFSNLRYVYRQKIRSPEEYRKLVYNICFSLNFSLYFYTSDSVKNLHVCIVTWLVALPQHLANLSKNIVERFKRYIILIIYLTF